MRDTHYAGPPGGNGSAALPTDPPHNFELEQATLGALLLDNAALRQMPSLRMEHFFDPLHQRIFEVISAEISAGYVATPVSIKHHFELAPPIGDLTVAQYLGRLAANAATTINAPSYAASIRKLALRRAKISFLQQAAYAASIGDDDAEIHARRLLGETETEHASGSEKKFIRKPLFALTPTLNNIWRVKHLLPAKGVASAFGPTQGGKSVVILDLCLHIVTGRMWAGKKVSPCPVCYIAAESGGGFENRAKGAAIRLGIPLDAPFDTITVAPNLGEEGGDADRLIAEIGAQGERPGVIVIDTLAKTMIKADENSSRDMGIFFANAERIAKHFDCLVMVVHHTGKDETKGGRGSNLLVSNAECEWQILNDEEGRRVHVNKQKDGPSGYEWSFKVSSHVIGQDEDGDDVTIAVADITSEAEIKAGEPTKAKGRKCTSDAADRDFEKAVSNAMDGAEFYRVGGDGPLVRAVPLERIRTWFYRFHATGEEGEERKTDTMKKAFQRALGRRKSHYCTEQIPGGRMMFWSTKSRRDS